MRKNASGLVNVRAVSGTHVVFLALNMKESAAKGLLGFAIHRTDLIENESGWLKGNKTFATVRATTAIEDASSHEHPFQAFQWCDYAAKPGCKYRYRVVPMFGERATWKRRKRPQSRSKRSLCVAPNMKSTSIVVRSRRRHSRVADIYFGEFMRISRTIVSASQ